MKKFEKHTGNVVFRSRLLTRISVALLCGLLMLASARAQQATGGIRGSATDKDFEVPLAGVKVTVAETGASVVADDSGYFMIKDVPAGSYTLIFRKDGYERVVKSGVVVGPGQMGEVDAALPGSYEDMDEFVVRDIELGGSSEMGLLNLRMDSASMMDSVGSEMMSKAGASDAAGALKLVAGATVQDGKYAVVRGLPDRYVSSQMNGVRLPTADPDKRAVQLDQFPSAVIESMQVAKTFTPDQQGDASGGAVNVKLKGIPDGPVFKVKVGTKYKTNVNGKDFLTYEGGGVNFWGKDDGSRDPQDTDGDPTTDKIWDGAYGVKRGNAPFMYDWSLTGGDSFEVSDNVRVGAVANAFYKHDASSYDDGVNDKYWLDPTSNTLVPKGLEVNGSGELVREGADESGLTSLYDVQKSTDKVQWGGLGAAGIETEHNELTLLYMQTHVAEDKATLAEDTRGRDEFSSDLPYLRAHTLEYVERDTDTLQLSGDHTLSLPEFGIDGFLSFLEPEFDWTVARSSSSLDSPDKRIFGSVWNPAYEEVVYGYDPSIPPWGGFGWITNSAPSTYTEDKADASTFGNVQRIWKEVTEDSDQYFVNTKLPFEQWSGEKGFVKLGLFKDKVERRFNQDSYSNTRASGDVRWEGGDWTQYWSDVFAAQGLALDPSDPNFAAEVERYQMHEAFEDVDYTGNQEIAAWYYMVDLPLTSFLKVTGGARYETTKLDVEFDAEKDVKWKPEGQDGLASFADYPPPNNPIDQEDILPSLSFELKPLESLALRGCYSETVARPTFKEFSPVISQEYVGGDIFIGNSSLTMSALQNYDLRCDWTPYPGGLVSLSWFKKNIDNPIEYSQKEASNVGLYTTAVNYPEGRIEGYEVEVRQSLGEFVGALSGLSLGGNLTMIDSEVTMPEDEVQRYYQTDGTLRYGFVETKRDMLNAPEYLYNLYTTYDIDKTGTKLGLFYTVKGDTLLAGPSTYGKYSASVYALEYATLNFTLSQKLGENWSLSFKAKNLTNPKIQEVSRSEKTDEEALKSSYTKGLEFSVSLGCSW